MDFSVKRQKKSCRPEEKQNSLIISEFFMLNNRRLKRILLQNRIIIRSPNPNNSKKDLRPRINSPYPEKNMLWQALRAVSTSMYAGLAQRKAPQKLPIGIETTPYIPCLPSAPWVVAWFDGGASCAWATRWQAPAQFRTHPSFVTLISDSGGRWADQQSGRGRWPRG